MGVVYRAEDTRLGRSVALKVLPDALARDAAATERLLLEARAAAALDHPHVCTIYDVAEADAERPYIAFACYDGETLDGHLARGPLSVDEAVRIVREVASGVAAAHAVGIVHRDLKPSNVFLTEGGAQTAGAAKVLDFGIARVPGAALTQEGHAAGTVAYSAPEQVGGQADARADVWALGVVLYEALTGRHPFAAPYESAVLYAILHEDPPPPSTLNPDVPAEIDAVVARCLANEPAGRYRDAAALEAALADTSPAPPRPFANVAAVGRRAGWRQWAAVAVGVATVTVGAWAALSGRAAAAAEVGVAVLPFTVSPDTQDEQAFAGGLASALANGIAEVAASAEDLWVLSASEVEDGGVESVREAAEVLRVDRVVVGSLRNEGGRWLLDLSLVDADTRRTLDATRPLSFEQDEIGRIRGRAVLAIARMLDLEISEEDEARLTIASADPEATDYYFRGVYYLERERDAGDLDRAVDLFGQAIREDSAFAQAHARLGETYLAKYETTRDSSFVGLARNAAERARSLDERDASVHVTLSKLSHTTGKSQMAMHHARRALNADPSLFEAHLALAAAQEVASDIEAAEATIRDAADLNTRAWRGPLHLGRFYFGQQRFDEAVVQFGRVIALAPNHYIGHLSMGGAHHNAGDVARARQAYLRAIDLRPDHYAAYSNLGTLLLGEGDAGGAVRRYRQALRLDSTKHDAWRNLASAYSETGDTGLRTDALRGALRRAEGDLVVRPADPVLLASVATYREALGERAGALDAASRAAAGAPGNGSVQDEVARVFAALGQVDQAVRALNAAARLGVDLSHIVDDDAFADVRSHPSVQRLLPGS